MKSKILSEDEAKEHLNRYSERYRFWTNQAIIQLGYSTNLFTTLAVAFLAFLFNQRENFNKIVFDTKQSIDWSLLFYFIACFGVLIAVLFGLIAVTSRLYDIRITRNKTWVRKRVMKEKSMSICDDDDFNNKISIKTLFCIYLKTLWKIELVNIDDIKKDIFEEKFKKLRNQTFFLGKMSWLSHKLQLISLLLALLFYLFALGFS